MHDLQLKEHIVMRKYLFLSAVLFFLTSNLQGNVWSQPKGDTHTKETPIDRTIRGKVLDDNLEPIIDVIIKINDSVKVGKTGVDGTFEITTSIPINQLYFESIGWEDAKISLSNDCNNIELIMQSMYTYCFLSLDKINKRRKKELKKLKKIHKQAYQQGLFLSPEPCYIREFIEEKWDNTPR